MGSKVNTEFEYLKEKLLNQVKKLKEVHKVLEEEGKKKKERKSKKKD